MTVPNQDVILDRPLLGYCGLAGRPQGVHMIRLSMSIWKIQDVAAIRMKKCLRAILMCVVIVAMFLMG